MHEKVEHLFPQKTQSQNKLRLPLLSLLLQILLNVNFIYWIFTINIVNNFNRYFKFFFLWTKITTFFKRRVSIIL